MSCAKFRVIKSPEASVNGTQRHLKSVLPQRL